MKTEFRLHSGWPAYFTVEAVLIFPMVLYVCVFIIYSGFYIYDRCVTGQDAYRAALRASSLYRQDNQEVYNAAEDTLRMLMKDKYIAAECNFTIKVQQEVSITVAGSTAMPFQGLKLLTGTEDWYIEETAKSKCINAVVFIRMCRQIENAKK
ncbi:MAG: pilus assembly protein [Lachnospiraceae bacterium]|nr:pilus assembly protein [Lachnospiraceae bacterium]